MLHAAGCTSEVFSRARPAYQDPWKDMLWVRAPKTFTIWIILYHSGDKAGKVEVQGFSAPFVVNDLWQMGPSIVKRILYAMLGPSAV